MKAQIALFCAVASAGCSQSVTGISEWDTVLKVAHAAIVQGDTGRFLCSLDVTGIPTERAVEIEKHFRSRWKGAPAHLKLVATKVVDADEAEALKRERRKDWPEEMKATATKWGVKPDKVILYEFAGDDSIVVWAVGAFQKDGAWFFTGSY